MQHDEQKCVREFKIAGKADEGERVVIVKKISAIK